MKKARIEIRLESEEEKKELLKISKKEGYKTFSDFFRARLKRDFSPIYRSQLESIKFNPRENKNDYIKFNLTQEDKILIIKKAESENMKISEFGRRQLKASLTEDYLNEIEQLEKLRFDTMRTRQAIASLTANINQIAKAYNSGEHPSKWIERDLLNRENLKAEITYLVKQNKEIIAEIDKILRKRRA